MKRLVLIMIGIAFLAALIAFGFGSMAGGNAASQAKSEATAAMIFASLTFQAPATPTPAGTPTLSNQEIALLQLTAVHDNGLTQAAHEEELAAIKQQNELAIQRQQMQNDLEIQRQQAQLEQARIDADLREKELEAKIRADGNTATAIYAAQTAVRSDALTSSAAGTHAVETAVKSTEEAPRIQAEFEARMAQEELDRRQKAADVAQAELGVQRTAASNTFRAFWPYAAGLVIAWVGGKGITQWVKTRAHARDESGRSQTIQKETRGGTVFVSPDQLETGVVKVTNDGDVIRYAPMDKDEQSAINRGRSLADMIGQLPQGLINSGKKWIEGFGVSKNAAPSRFMVRGDGRLSSVIEQADDSVVEAE